MLSPAKLILTGIVILALTGAFAAYRASLINEGWDRALQKVEQKNAEAAKAASAVQRSVDECYDSGRVWDTISGECSR